MAPSRRHFMLGAGSAVALGSLPLNLNAQTRLQLHSGVRGLVVYREAQLQGRAFAAAMMAAGLATVTLGEDPVWQWRTQLAATVAGSKAPVYGLTDWSDYQLMRGLCAELRRYPIVETRHCIGRSASAEWAVRRAQELLDGQPAPRDAPSGQLTFFTWVIS
ncbi:MAG: hypothetical protein RQ899_05990 [Pseudomonadales bacterium]|nr:hypothetical protein [Pseudomonadales bacterium]